VRKINVSRVLRNSRFSEDFTVYRKTGDWVNGRFVETETPILVSGAVTIAGAEDIVQTPEGDRISGVLAFHSTTALFVTRNENEDKGTSDEILWEGKRYKLHEVKPWKKFGYYRALGTVL
jgi:hypothetical protein